MTATTTITCTKSQFREALVTEYQHNVTFDEGTLDEVIDGLVRQANEHRGTFEGHSAYLDLDFTVTPDDAPPADLAAEHMAKPGQLNSVHPSRMPVQPKTMADYRPGAAVRRMLSELSYVHTMERAVALRMVRTAVDAELGEQGITEHLGNPREEIEAWIAEEVHEMIANRD